MRLLFESGYYSRAAFIKLSGIGKIFCECKGFEKSQFYKINKELRCDDLVLKQNFQLLDQPSLSYKALPTQHRNELVLEHHYTTIILYDIAIESRGLFTCARATRILAAASIRERRLFRSAHLEVRRQFESGD